MRIPRKLKKRIYGRRINKSKLKRLLEIVELGEPIKTMYEVRDIKPFIFCPNCGCENYQGTGNLTSYPEHWERFHCIRCHRVVGYIDNSQFIHALECSDNNYNPEF